jgi:hypothetical protein
VLVGDWDVPLRVLLGEWDVHLHVLLGEWDVHLRLLLGELDVHLRVLFLQTKVAEKTKTKLMFFKLCLIKFYSENCAFYEIRVMREKKHGTTEKATDDKRIA